MAEAIEVANAYVALTTKMPGVKKEIEGAVGGVDTTSAGKKLGGQLMGGLKVGALAVSAAAGAAVVGTLGVALTKGFSRLTGIDNATAKMKGLGFSAKDTQGLMDNALESVSGTAFGLQDAAGVAAQLAATGIGPGKQMSDVLSTIANTAAAAGGGMDEMGSIFAKVASSGKAQNDSLQQLSDRGIPIYQKLAEQLGVTSDEVFALASKGEISFQQFADAAEAAGGGVAAAMGETVTGSFANLQASLGRIGANLLGGTFEGLAPAIQGVTEVLGPLEKAASGVGEKIGDGLAPLLDGLANLAGMKPPAWMSALGEELSGGITAFFAAFEDGGDDITSSGLAGFLEALGLAARALVDTDIMSFISPLGVAFQLLAPVLPQLLDAFSEIVVILSGALADALNQILPFVGELIELFAGAIAEILPQLMPLLMVLVDLFIDILDAVMPLLPPLFDLIEAILPILVGLIEVLIPVFEGAANAIGSILMPIVDGLVETLDGLITFLTGVFTGDWEKAWEGLVGIFSGIWNTIIGIVEGVINGVIDLINGFLGGLNKFGSFIDDIPGVDGFEIGMIGHVNFDAAKFANGGIVPSSNGGTLGVIGEAGRDEVILPLPDDWRENGIGGGGDVNVTVNPAPGMDEAVIGRIAAQEIDYALRGV